MIGQTICNQSHYLFFFFFLLSIPCLFDLKRPFKISVIFAACHATLIFVCQDSYGPLMEGGTFDAVCDLETSDVA
jgi:hypothetical protein